MSSKRNFNFGKNFRENKSFFKQTYLPFGALGALGSSLRREIALSSIIRAQSRRCSDVDRAGVDNTRRTMIEASIIFDGEMFDVGAGGKRARAWIASVG
jgi:hypothetical protein